MKRKLIGLAVSLGLVVVALVPASASAQYYHFAADAATEVCKGVGLTSDGENCEEPDEETNVNSVIALVINLLSLIGGIVAIIFLIVAGLKYITANGDSNAISSAKTTIIYVIVGLIVIAFSQVIVRYVVNRATQDPSADETSLMIRLS